MKKLLCVLSVAMFTGAALGGLYSEPFDSAAADVTILQEADTAVSYVDYSNMTVGATNFNIPEAPRPVGGGAPTRGVLLQANIASGAAVGVNVLAGQVPINFSGNYTVSFDAYLNFGGTTGTTEQLLWGVGSDGAGPIEARHNRGGGAIGTWGWLAGENGYGTEDTAINENDIELADLGDTQAGEDAPFNAAFLNLVGGPNGAPAYQWVAVDIVVGGGNVSVNYNGVEFFNEPSAATNGFAMLGYEDPFSSISDSPDANWGLFDNFVVTPEPTSAMLMGLGLLAFARRRR